MNWVENKKQAQSFIDKFIKNFQTFIKKRSQTLPANSQEFALQTEDRPFIIEPMPGQNFNSNVSINENIFKERKSNMASLVDIHKTPEAYFDSQVFYI